MDVISTRFTARFDLTVLKAIDAAAFVSAVRPARQVLQQIGDDAEAVLRSRPASLLA